MNDAKIAFVGEGPGQVEDEKRRPFVGKAGRVLKVIEWAAGIDQYKVFHTNATRCWGRRNPKPDEVDACHDYLIQELRELQPTVIVALGGAALRSLYRPGVTVGSVMGFTLYNDELPGIPIIPTYHPSYIMRGHWGEVALVLAHFAKARRIAETGSYEERLGSYVGVTTLEDLRGLRDYLLGLDVETIAIDCVTPETPVLRADLTWVSASSLKTGDEVISFDEEIPESFGTRRFRKAAVRNHGRKVAPLYEVLLETGETLRCTGSHKWLVRGGRVSDDQKNRLHWIRTDELMEQWGRGGGGHRITYRIPRILPMWYSDTSYEAGLLAGAFDADGTFTGGRQRAGGLLRSSVNFSQRPGLFLDCVAAALKNRGFSASRTVQKPRLTSFGQQNHDQMRLTLKGGYREQLRFLGQIRPVRLLDKWQRDDRLNGHMMQAHEWVQIQSVRLIGTGEVVQLESESGTYLASGFPAHNTETTGLSWMDSELLCVSFSGEAGVGFSVPILHRGERTVMKVKGRGKNRKEVPETEWAPVPFWEDNEFVEVYTILDEILRSEKPKSGQNIGFDLRMLERRPDEVAVKARTAFGFYVNNVVHDTRMLSSLLSEATPANLTVMTAYHTDIPYYEQEVAPFKSKMWHLPDEKLWEYGGADADVVQTLVPKLHPKVQDEGTDWVYRNISIPLIRCATKLEERGVYIDQEYFDKLCRYYKDNLVERKAELNEAVGREVKAPTHYQHVQQLVFKDLDLPLTRLATDGALKDCDKCRRENSPCSPAHASTSADSLAELNERAPHPVLPLLIDIRHLEKFSSTYLDGGEGGGFRAHIREDGRIHARWNAARAATGRFSCENPNLMNPPKEVKVHSDEYDIHSDDAIRSMFSAPPGYGVLNADWSQAEVWVMAYATGDETLLRLLMEGKDIHAYVARELCRLGISSRFPIEAVDEALPLVEWKAKYKDIRDQGKVFVFGMNYGLTDEGAGQRLSCSREEAAPLLAHYVQYIFPSMGTYFLRIRDEMFRHGSAANRFRRRRHFAEVPILAALKFRGDLEGAVRQGYNMPVQGGAHDLHSLAHIATEDKLSSFTFPVLEMHDSLMMYSAEDRLEEAAAAVKELWESVARDTILPSGERLDWAIPVDVQWGKNFGDLEVRLD